MKIVLSAILACLLLSSCSTFHQGKNFSVTIKMDSALAATKQKVYLYELIRSEWSILDSALICNNKRKVKLEGKIPFQHRIDITFEKEGPVNMPIIATPGDKIKIKLAAKDITGYDKYAIDIPNINAHHEYYKFQKRNRELRINRRELKNLLLIDTLNAARKNEIEDSIKIDDREIRKIHEDLALSDNPANVDYTLTFLSMDYHCADKYKDYLLKKFPDYPPIKEDYDESYVCPKASPQSKIIEAKINAIQITRTHITSNEKATVSANKGDTLSIMLHKEDGSSESLNKYRGKYVLVEFWASWCGPCLRAMPKLIETKNKFTHDLEICAITLDKSKLPWINSIRNNHLSVMHHYMGINSDGKLFKDIFALGMQGIPQNYLLDTDGKIIARNIYGDELMDKLNELMKTK